MATNRAVVEGRQLQGADEKIAYQITVTNWGSSPTNASMVVKDMSNAAADVTSTVTTGSISIGGDVITLKRIQALTAGHLYRVEVKFDIGGNTFECYFEIQAEV